MFSCPYSIILVAPPREGHGSGYVSCQASGGYDKIYSIYPKRKSKGLSDGYIIIVYSACLWPAGLQLGCSCRQRTALLTSIKVMLIVVGPAAVHCWPGIGNAQSARRIYMSGMLH